MGVKTAYLFTYNVIQSCIWAYALFLLVQELISTGTHEGVHNAVTPVLRTQLDHLNVVICMHIY
eukprot:2849376-Pyramimonas_sp.AAC.1